MNVMVTALEQKKRGRPPKQLKSGSTFKHADAAQIAALLERGVLHGNKDGGSEAVDQHGEPCCYDDEQARKWDITGAMFKVLGPQAYDLAGHIHAICLGFKCWRKPRDEREKARDYANLLAWWSRLTDHKYQMVLLNLKRYTADD